MSKTWGTPTWLFMHSFIEHMSDKCYIDNRVEIINIYKTLCQLLPCPDCAKHATAHTKNLSERMVPTKAHMRLFLFQFHNAVNKRLRKPEFTDFDIYQRSRLLHIFRNFQTVFRNSGARLTDFSGNLNRNNLVNRIRLFINANNNQFTWL